MSRELISGGEPVILFLAVATTTLGCAPLELAQGGYDPGAMDHPPPLELATAPLLVTLLPHSLSPASLWMGDTPRELGM